MPETPSSSAKSRPMLREGVWVAGLFGLLVIFFFREVYFGGRIWLFRDSFCEFIPFLQMAGRIFADAAVPLWDPYSGGGQPFLADPKTGLFYPFHVLFYTLSSSLALKLTAFFHLTGGALAAYLLARHWRFGPPAAFLAGLCYVFGTTTICGMEFLPRLEGTVWWPLIFLAASRICEGAATPEGGGAWWYPFREGGGRVLWFAGCLTMAYLLSGPGLIYYTAPFVGAYVLGRFIWARDVSGLARALQGVGAGGAIALGAVFPLFLLTSELSGYSLWGDGIDAGLDQASMHPIHGLTALFPFLFGRPGFETSETYWAVTIWEFWIGTFYVGIFPLVLSTFGIAGWTARNPDQDDSSHFRFLTMFFLVAALLCLFLAAGQYTPLYAFLLENVPGFDRMRWPSRFLRLLDIPLAMLAALGLEYLVRLRASGLRPFPRRVRVVPWIWVVVFGFFAGCYLILDPQSLFNWLTLDRGGARADRLDDFVRQYLRSLLFLGLSAGLALCVLWKRVTMRVFAGLACALVFVDLYTVGRAIHPTSAEDVYAYEPGFWDQLEARADLTNYRVMSAYLGLQSALYANPHANAYKTVKNCGGGATMMARNFRGVRPHGVGQKRWHSVHLGIFTADILDGERERLKDMICARYVLAGTLTQEQLLGGGGLYAPLIELRETAIPRALLAGEWEAGVEFLQIVSRIVSPEFDMRNRIVIEPDEEGGMVPNRERRDTGTKGKVLRIEDEWNQVRVFVEPGGSEMLVLNDGWYPGWEALVDGVRRPIYRANALFRAVPVEAGDREVRFVYRPWRWRVGVRVSAASILAAVIWGCFYRRRRAG